MSYAPWSALMKERPYSIKARLFALGRLASRPGNNCHQSRQPGEISWNLIRFLASNREAARTIDAPVMCFMMLLASRSKVMGKFTLPLYLKILGWVSTSIMAVAAAGMLLTSGK
jgi:hypothetical protein